MFYSTELLSLHRRGKLARCWLAATFSENMFRKMCKPSLIEKLNIINMCEEILSTTEIRAGKNYGKFSLYLSAQLMYGVTKILFYQTKLFQDHLFKTSWKIFQTRRIKGEFNWLTDLEVPEVPAINEVFQNIEEPRNLHLINEEPYTAIGHLIEDEMNFGVLPNHEMEEFLLPEAEGLSLNEIRRCRWDEPIEILRESVELPLVDITKFEIDTVQCETEIQLAHKEQRESLIVFEDHKRVPTTPSKRTIRSPAEETPRKRSKISFTKELIQPLPAESASTLLLEPGSILENVPITESVPVVELTHELERTTVPAPENIELIEVTKKTRRRNLFDRQIKLNDALMQRNIQNVAVHTRPLLPHLVTLPSAKEHLEQPSTKIWNKLWGNTLTKLYNGYLKKPLSVEIQFEDVLDFEVEDTIVGETVRADTSSKLRDQTAEISSKITISAKDTTDPFKTSDSTLPKEDFGNKELVEHSKEANKSEELIIGLPEITDYEEKDGEETKILGKSLNKTKLRRTSKLSSSSISSKACLTKAELLALMEIHWTKERLIKFHDLISPTSYSKCDAAYVFQCCLGFEAEKLVILKQAEPFDTIYIEKYPYYSSENGEGNSST